MSAALSHNNTLDGCSTAEAGGAGFAKDHQAVSIATPPATDRIKVCLTGTECGAEICEASPKNFANGTVQGPNFTF